MGKPPSLNRIYTGDAVRLLRTWPASVADLIVTDPPYGNDAVYGRSGRRIVGDEHPLLGMSAAAACYRLLKRNATAYVFCGVAHLGFLQHFFLRYTRYRIRDVLVWDKVAIGFGSAFRRRFECILVLEKGRPRYRDRGLPDVLSVPRPPTDAHPHAKPVELVRRLVLTSSDEGDVVLDPFVGSGTTCVAAALTGRRYLGIEVAPEYAALARRRVVAAAREATS